MRFSPSLRARFASQADRLSQRQTQSKRTFPPARPLEVNLAIAARWILMIVAALIVLLLGAWCTLAIWFNATGSDLIRHLLQGLAVVFALATVVSLATPLWRIAVPVFLVAVAGMVIWWTMIPPSNDRDWQPDVARSVTATVTGDRLVVDNVRNFNWRSETDFDQRWEQRSYDLSQLHDVDLILSYWAGEAIAHLIVSFGFSDGQRLDLSIETRKQQGQAYSAVGGFFKQYEVIIIAADERDVVRLRSNIRNEDVRLYRLRMQPLAARQLLLAYVADMNELARTARWYNTATANCTTLVFNMAHALRPNLPLDYRILFSGYLPDYAYDVGATNTSMPFEQLRALSHVNDKARQADASSDFSAAIRMGIP